jgi:hypothetical protein
MEVPEEVNALGYNKVENANPADRRYEPIDQCSLGVRTIVFKPDDEVEKCNGYGCNDG